MEQNNTNTNTNNNVNTNNNNNVNPNNSNNSNNKPLDSAEELYEFFKDETEIKFDKIKDLEDPKFLPSYTEKQLSEYKEKVDEEAVLKLDDETKFSAYIVEEDDDDYRKTNPDNIGYRENNNSYDNHPTFEGNNLSIKQIQLNKRARTKKSALLKLTQKIGLGVPVNIQLWHSGFIVTITPLTTEEIISLEFDIVSELKRVGKITNTLIYSHYNIVFAEVIFKHFKRKIISTTVDHGDIELEELISINDLYSIALGLAITMYPKGFEAIIPCKNTIALDENNLPKCNYKTNVHLDLTELEWVDLSKLTIEQKQQMSKKAPKSVSVEEVIKYQESLSDLFTLSKDYNVNGEVLTINYKVPTVAKYFAAGNDFINSLKEKCNELVINHKDIDEETAEKMLLEVFKLKTYNHFIDSIPTDDTVIDDLDGINDALELINTDSFIMNEIINDIIKLMDSSLVSIIGIPSFICRKCNTVQTDKEIIPLPVYEYFFILLHSKYQRIMNQLVKQRQK